MHPNQSFRTTPKPEALRLARARAFGVLAVPDDPLPQVSHVPFLLSDDGTQADLHLVRSNPICRLARPEVPARLIVSGADGYISPDWYEMQDQVPTWNYIAVHLSGTLTALPPEQLEELLDRQSAFFESQLAKPPWRMDKLTDETRQRMLRMILPFRLTIDDVQSTFKLGQNKPEAARLAAGGQVPTGLGSELDSLASAMKSPPTSD